MTSSKGEVDPNRMNVVNFQEKSKLHYENDVRNGRMAANTRRTKFIRAYRLPAIEAKRQIRNFRCRDSELLKLL